MNTTLAISHNLFLTKSERYAWHVGQLVEVISVSVPVWFYKGASSEPAVEVFCKYRLINDPTGIFVKHIENGYEITVPKNPSKPYMPLAEVVWDKMSHEEKEKWYSENEPEPSLNNLLDIKDGGSQYLAFRQYSKIRKNKKILNVVHFVEIKDMDDLVKTLT